MFQVDVFIVSDNIVSVIVNHGTVAVRFSVDDKTVDDHVILKEIDVGDSNQGDHPDSINAVVVQADAVEDGFPRDSGKVRLVVKA